MAESLKVLSFKLRERPQRRHAMRWLLANYSVWPYAMKTDLSGDLFHGWQFIRCTDGEIVFADCIAAGITEEEFYSQLYLTKAGANRRCQ